MVATAAVTVETTDLHTILDLLPHAVVVAGRDWRIVYSNAEADRMLGSDGATLWERCPGLEHTAFASGFRYAMADRTELLTESVLPTVGWCQARARPTPDGALLINLRQIHAHTIETGQARTALLLGEIGDALTREDSLRAALKRCAEGMVRNLDAAQALIWTVDGERETLELCGTAGLDTRLDGVYATVRFGEHKLGAIAEHGMPYLTNDVATDDQVGQDEWVQRERIIAFAGYPLRIEDRIVGVMAMYSRRKIDHDTLNGLSAIADALALGIASKTANEARRAADATLRKQAGDLSVLHELSQQLSVVLEPDALAQKVIDATTRLAGASAGVFLYLTADGMQRAMAGANHGELVRQLPVLAAPTLDARKVVRHDDAEAVVGRRMQESGVHEIPDAPVEAIALRSFLALPVIGRKDRLLGVLAFGHPRPSAFSNETERLLAGVASTAAIAMDNARLFDEARALIAALEKSNRELDQFAYVASHDLKAPLRGIANLSQWIEDDLGERIDDQARQHLHLLRGRVIRLENLIGGILAYSRAGRDNTERVSIDVAALVGEVWELVAPPTTARLAVEPPLPQLKTSRVQLQQVMMNLIGNALKYNADRELTVTVSARRVGRRWEFSVADDGVGIAPEFADKIWGLFQTLERRDKVESTGIGLSVVRKIVESQGGNAWLSTEPRRGALFHFTWPADPDEAHRG